MQSERVRLRAPERSDLPTFVRWINDAEVTAGLLMYLPMSLTEEEAWFERMMQRPPEEHVMVIEAACPEGWRMIGSCGFHNISWKDRLGEVGIMIGEKEYWGHGYGTEAMRLLVRHGFENLTSTGSSCRCMITTRVRSALMKRSGLCWKGGCARTCIKTAATTTCW